MIFLLVFGLIIFSQVLFSSSFFSDPSLVIQTIGFVQLSGSCACFFMLMYFFSQRKHNDYKRGFSAFGGFILFSVPASFYLIPGLLFQATGNELFKLFGWVLAALLFLGILIGIFYGRWNWKIHRVKLSFPHFPDELDSLKIVQISDIHVGSFFDNHDKVNKAIDMINSLKADYVFFTGDLVNNTALEMDGWEPIFQRIEAKKGKFSILGNHDYGDYVRWEQDALKIENLERLIAKHREIGFTPLLNESVQLEKGIWLLGVENWGKAPFRQSGKLQHTMNGVPETALKILLSHDPSHFDMQVVETDIDLTLSGHTHGMQFGIERFGIKWSPVSLRYKKWAGLYKEGKQYLYVNRGFGYLGFPGRVGIYPEITEITITKS
jgi:predicted MPP superfamily phosphohydrolase